jgi:putative NADH-flavin reductase
MSGDMRLFVLGANGRTGRQLVSAALTAGHQVTAFVRRTGGLPDSAAGLNVVVGDVVAEPEALTDALHGHDVVLSALGNGLSLRDGRAPKILKTAMEHTVRAMRHTDARRVITMLSYGSGATTAHAPWYVRLLAATVLREDFADLGAADRVLTGSGLDWTVAHFGSLTDGPPTGAAISTELVRPRRFAISRPDVAAALLTLAGTDSVIRRRVVLDGMPTGGAGRIVVPAATHREHS